MTQMDTISAQELDEIYAFAIDLGKRAGKILLDTVEKQVDGEGSGSPDQFVEKDSSVDIVTQTDEEVEQFIRGEIQRKYPAHRFLGEETYAKGESREYLIDEKPTWCVDPLDGTVNFTHIFPLFCVSIGFIVNHRPIIGVINAPFQNQLFTACAGRGAWLNDKYQLPLRRNPTPPSLPEDAPRGCVFACEWGKDRRDVPGGNLRRKVESFVNMATELGGRDGKGGMVHGIRSLGSATMDLAYTAMGAVDIWWEGGCWEWDVAAGVAILLEAGGLVTTANPPENPDTAPIEDVRLGSRLYLAIRPAGPSEKETGREGQERVVREVWRRVQKLDYSRPGA